MWFAQESLTTTNVTITTEEATGLAALGFFWLLFWLVILVAYVVAMWKLFEKADEPGWAAIIPFYNTYTLFRIAGRNGWWFLGMFVPFLNIVVAIILSIDLAKHFGKDTVFGIFALFLFSIIGYFILGFSSSVKYVGPKHQ